MKRPQTLVWTPDSDRRSGGAPSAAKPPTPTPAKPKAINPAKAIPVATQPPVPVIKREPPIASVTPPIAVAPKPRKPKEPKLPTVWVPSKKQQRRAQADALMQDHGITEHEAYEIVYGRWTLEEVQKPWLRPGTRNRAPEYQAFGPEADLFQRWVQEGTALVRLDFDGVVPTRLTGVTQFDFQWNDQAEPRAKIDTFAILTASDWESWGIGWEADLEVADQKRQVASNPRKRWGQSLKISALEESCNENTLVRVKLLNGLKIFGYVQWWHTYGTWISLDPAGQESGCLILTHGCYSMFEWPRRPRAPRPMPSQNEELIVPNPQLP